MLGSMRWRLAPVLGIAAAAVLAAGCGDRGTDDSWSARAIAQSVETSPAMPTLLTKPSVGTSRLSFAFFDSKGAVVGDADVDLTLYALEEDEGGEVTGSRVSEHELQPVTLGQGFTHVHTDGAAHTHSGPETTVFVANAQFERAEWWGAELSGTIAGERYTGLRYRFWVNERSDEPMLGESIPRSEQLVLADVDDIAEIDTSNPPIPEMHDMTVAEALATGKPLVVAFATPAFCRTRFCGPVVDEVMRPLHERFGEQAEFLHIEPYDVARAREGNLVPEPIMAEWRLTTEPWIFVVDREGRVAAKFEGITSAAEVEAALAPLLEGR